MARPKRKAIADTQADLLDVTSKLRTAPCVPALREAVKAWVAGGYKGITDTTSILLNYWFHTDHKLPTGRLFRYHRSQQEAIETLIFIWEFEKVRKRKDLLERYAQSLQDVRLPPFDDFARYCIKMATGSGKTKVMSLAVAWQFLNAVREPEAIAKDYCKTFLLIAPNVIVLERLKTDFAGGRVFRTDPVIPRELEIFWELDCVMRDDAERVPFDGMLFLTNIQQFYERPDRSGDAEPEEMTAILGSKPPTKKLDLSTFDDRIALRAGNLMVLNDEAHHTHDEGSEWNEFIRSLHTKTPLAMQLDFSATPRFQKGAIFPLQVGDAWPKCHLTIGAFNFPELGFNVLDEIMNFISPNNILGFCVDEHDARFESSR